MLFWAGLRGAVAVAMALALPVSVPERTLLQEITFGIVLFTLIVQGTTAGLVVRRAVGESGPDRGERARSGAEPPGDRLAVVPAEARSPSRSASRQTRQSRSTSSSRSTASSRVPPTATAP